MAEILANWINNELELSKHVDNFEQDFSNGFLFGEILKRYNQQSDFEDFSKKATRDSKVNNFCLLEPTLKSLSIKFNTQLVDDIMKEKRGAAMRILIQLKMALEKVYSPMDNVPGRSGHKSDSKPAKKLKPGKEKYDTMSSTLFKRRLQEMNEAQKEVNLRTHQNRFEEIRQKQEEKARREDENEQNRKTQQLADTRRGQIDKIQRNSGFMEEWLRKGIEDWKSNQTSKRIREKKQLEFELTRTKKIETMTIRTINQAKSEVTDGIDAFEKNLKTQGIDPDEPGSSASSPSKGRLGQTSASRGPRHMAISMTQSLTAMGGTEGTKMRERGSTMTEATRKERERRRGKLIKSLNNDILRDMENQTREEQYVERLKRQSKQEEELAYEIWRTQQCKNVVVENRKLREARYYKRKELDTNNAYAREEEMLRTLDEQRNIDEESQVEREDDLRINKKQSKRQIKTELCDMMMNEIFEIANQAYILQQKQDSEDIDDRFWREWMQLFKEETSIKQTFVEGKPDPDEDDDHVVDDAIVDTEADTQDMSEKILDDAELTDYLKNSGQWKSDLVTAEENKVDIAAILGGGEPTGGKGAKGAPAEAKIDEKEMEVPESLPKNNILGDVVEQIIYLNFEGEKDIVKPHVPSHVPLKIAITGQAFSGKKTQAQLLSEKYNLIQYHPYELINEAIERAEEELEQVSELNEQPEQAKNEAEGDAEAQPAEGEAQPAEGENATAEGEAQPAEGEANTEAQPQPEGTEVTPGDDNIEQPADAPAEETPAEGQETHKEVNVPNEDKPLDIIQEGDHQEILDVEAEFERQGQGHTDNTGPEMEKYEKHRRNKFRDIGKLMKEQLINGEEIEETLVVDLLVAKIKSDFAYKTQEQIESEIKKIIEREEQIKEELQKADELKGKSFKNVEPIDDAALRQELEDLSKYSQYGWILVDFPNSITQAHKLEAELSGYLPSIDRDIVERNEKLASACRIIEPSDKPNIKDTLIESGLDSVLLVETERTECRRRALGRRVDVSNQNEYHIDDNPPPTTNPPLCERLLPVIEPERAEEVIPDKHLAFDSNRKRLLQWYEKFGYEKDDDDTTKFACLHHINGDATSTHAILDDNTVLDQILTRKQNQWSELREKFRTEIVEEKERVRLEEEARLKAEEEQCIKEEEEAKRLAELAEKGEDGEEQEQPPAETPAEEPKPDETEAQNEGEEQPEEPAETEPPSKDNIDDDLSPVLMNIWGNIEEKYITRMKKSFNLYRNQKERIVTGFSKTSKYFVQYLNRPDTKQARLDEFVSNLNKFTDEYPDLREDEQTKEELHQRTDTLSDELWELSETRQQEAIDERQKIMENGWIEFELDQVTAMAHNLMQAEVDKFRSCAHLLQDYYYAIEDRLLSDPPEALNYELVASGEDGEQEEMPPVFEKDAENPESEETYPRLDKLYGKALKAQVIPELENTPPGGAAAGNDKAKGKKDPKKGAVEEETEEKYFYEQELQDAIDTEKGVLRYRLTMVHNWALNRMKEIRSKSQNCYDKLNTWVQVAFKAETDAILEQEKVIKKSIEEEEKLQHELRIRGMDFYLDEKFLNFEDPPKEILHAREEPMVTRFTIKQLESLVNEFIVSSVDGSIGNEYFVDLMMARTKNTTHFSDENSIPEIWKSYDRGDYELITKLFDLKLTGTVSFKKVAITM